MTKRDRQTLEPLMGAVYSLYQNGRLVAETVSSSNGTLFFTGLTPGVYELTERTAPAGYQVNTEPHIVIVDGNGDVTIDGVSAVGYTLYDLPLSSLSLRKVDAVTGSPVAGAAFTLSNGVRTQSDENGMVHFGTLAPGSYTFRETTVPSGYLPNDTTYRVEVSDNGEVTINGTPVDNFTLQNQPNPDLVFPKLDGSTGQPLAGAVFTLSNGQTATSGDDGRVSFGPIAPGSYTMRETTVPNGYAQNTAVYPVTVTDDGAVTVNGLTLSAFSVPNTPTPAPSPAPTISAITEGDTTITGQGVAGAAIVVTLPDNTTLDATVAANGTWAVTIPAGTTLTAGQTVRATQTVPGSPVSREATDTVRART